MMLDTKNEQKWPLTAQKCFLSQTGSSSQGSFHFYMARCLVHAIFRTPAGVFFIVIKSGQPIGRPTYSAYHTSLAVSSGFVFLRKKSVFCTNTFCLFYIVLHLDFCIFLWYLIGTKRWYQCTGKSLRSYKISNQNEMIKDLDDDFR